MSCEDLSVDCTRLSDGSWVAKACRGEKSATIRTNCHEEVDAMMGALDALNYRFPATAEQMAKEFN